MSLVQAIPMPAPVVFYFTYNGQPIENFQVTFIVGSTSITRMTNENGGIHIDVDPEGGDFKNNGDTLIVDCGFAVCDKSYSVDMLRQKPYSETFALAERPPTTCPPCDCSGGGSSSGGCYIPPDECEECPLDTTPYASCNSCCTEEECVDVVCPICPSPSECPECQPCDPSTIIKTETNIGAIIIAIIGSLLVGGAGGIFFTRNKALGKQGGIKVYQGRDGTEKTLHKHPGIKGYHDPGTEHRVKKERHPKGQLFPKYEKDSLGEWVYVG